jgi:bifunctional DNA-binding transcriptional regulator/antitoxin component of YhaV-PrlF toxin-antitoxin module
MFATITDAEITEMLADTSELLEQWYVTDSINLDEGDKVRLEFERNCHPVSGTFVRMQRGLRRGDAVILRVTEEGHSVENAYALVDLAAIVLERRMDEACGSFTGAGRRCETCRFLKHLH